MKLNITFLFILFSITTYAQKIDHNITSLLNARHSFAFDPKVRFNLSYHISISPELNQVSSTNLREFDKLSLSVAKLLTNKSRCSENNGISRIFFQKILKRSETYLKYYQKDLKPFFTSLEKNFSLWLDKDYCLKRLILKSDEFYEGLFKSHDPYLVNAFQNILREALSIQDIASSDFIELEVNPRVNAYLSYYKEELQKTSSLKDLSEKEKKEILFRITRILSFFTDKVHTRKFLIDLSLALHSENANERYIFPLMNLMERLSLRGVTELNTTITSMIGIVNEDLAHKLSREMNQPYQNLLMHSSFQFQQNIQNSLNHFQQSLHLQQVPFTSAFVLGAFNRVAKEISNEFDYSFRGNEAINRVMASSFRGNPLRALMGNNHSTLVGQTPQIAMEMIKGVPNFVAEFFEKTANYYNKRSANDFNTCKSNCGKETLSRTFADMGTGFHTAITTASTISASSGGVLLMPGAAAASIAGLGHFAWDFTETLKQAKSCQASCNRFQQSESLETSPASNNSSLHSQEKEKEKRNKKQAQDQEIQNKGEMDAKESRDYKETMNSVASQMESYSIKDGKTPQSANTPQADSKTEYEKKENEKNCQSGSNCIKQAVGCVVNPESVDDVIRFYTIQDMQNDINIKKGSLIIYINDEVRNNSANYYRGNISLSILKLINFIDPFRNTRRNSEESPSGRIDGVIGQPGWVDPPKPINFH